LAAHVIDYGHPASARLFCLRGSDQLGRLRYSILRRIGPGHDRPFRGTRCLQYRIATLVWSGGVERGPRRHLRRTAGLRARRRLIMVIADLIAS
jgi:hypothetical protein